MSRFARRKQRLRAAGLCSDCAAPEFRGGRCWYHYVRRYYRRRGFLKFQWYQAVEKQFTTLLLGRYAAIAAGGDAPSMDPITILFEKKINRWMGRGPAPWRVETGHQLLFDSIKHWDRMALKERTDAEEQGDADAARGEVDGGGVGDGEDGER